MIASPRRYARRREPPHPPIAARWAPPSPARGEWYSEQLEIFALLPLRHLEVEAGELGLLDVREIIDEGVAETGAEARARAQRRDRLAERPRQQRRRVVVGRLGRLAGIEASGDAVEPGDDLRGHVEIRVRRRLADAVLE